MMAAHRAERIEERFLGFFIDGAFLLLELGRANNHGQRCGRCPYRFSEMARVTPLTVACMGASELAEEPAITSPAIALTDVTIAYDRHPVIHHLSGNFAAGSLTAIIGPNGAGKSSLLKAIAGLLPLYAGKIATKTDAKNGLAFLPQAAEVDRSFPISVMEVVDFGHWRRTGAFGRIDAQKRVRSKAALGAVGLSGTEQAPIGHLSIGQLQRVLFARLIVQDADVILLDEPFNAVDAATIDHLMGIIAQWHREGRTVLAALHDFDQVRRLFPQTLLIARERVGWGKTEDIVTPDNLRRATDLAQKWSDPAEICRYPLPVAKHVL